MLPFVDALGGLADTLKLLPLSDVVESFIVEYLKNNAYNVMTYSNK